jgi:hypothetical protein
MQVLIQLFLYDFAQCQDTWELNRKQYRLRETCFCLAKNCEDPSIESMHIFVETEGEKQFFSDYTKQYSKAVYIVHGKQPTFKDFMDYAKKTFTDNQIVCIMNSDIIFNLEKDHELIRKIAKPKRLISLTRHELTDDDHTICTPVTCEFARYGGSSDVFIFTMPLQENFPFSSIDHKQNMFGAEHVFHKAWHDCGYEIINPCDDIITIHIHKDRTHFVQYETVDKQDGTNAVYNPKTNLPIDA